MLFYIYSDAPGSTIDITSRCRVGRLSVKDNAEEGSVAISNLIVDDPNGDLELTGHRRIYIYESDAPILNQVIFNGFVVNERIERGPYRTGAGRQWVIDLADPDVFINRRIMNGADANRPAEPDLARMQALLTMTELNTVDDDTYVNTTAATVAMDAVDYRGQNVGAYVDDCRQASGKNGYILYNETLGQYGLWYDFDYSTAYDSACFLTNTATEANHSTVFLYSQERTYLNRDPSRVASGIYLEYDGGTVYVQDDDTTDEFAAIDWAAPSINVKSLTKATARANRYLAGAATEDNIVHTVMTKVPRANVNKIKKGQLVKFKASWMTDYTAYTTFRVLYRTVTEISEDPQASFEIEMDLTPEAGEGSSLILYRSQSADTNGSVTPIGWVCGGDGVADGLTCNSGTYPSVPSVGALDGTLGTFGGTIATITYLGLEATGTGTMDLTWGGVTTPLQVFTACGGITATVQLLKNGSVVGTSTLVTPGGGSGHTMPDITLTGLAVTNGDVFTARMSHSGGCILYIDGGNLTVTGSLFV